MFDSTAFFELPQVFVPVKQGVHRDLKPQACKLAAIARNYEHECMSETAEYCVNMQSRALPNICAGCPPLAGLHYLLVYNAISFLIALRNLARLVISGSSHPLNSRVGYR